MGINNKIMGENYVCMRNSLNIRMLVKLSVIGSSLPAVKCRCHMVKGSREVDIQVVLDHQTMYIFQNFCMEAILASLIK